MTRPETPPARYSALDVLRGIAILMMVVNHGGLLLLQPELQAQPFFRWLIFTGSLAPVLFYFVTGIGHGLNSHKPVQAGFWPDVLFKALVLVLIERIARLNAFLGMDFLSFIALILLLLSALRYWRQGWLPVLLLIVGLLAARYAVGPALSKALPVLPAPVEWLLGVNAVHNVSYPASPWLVFPLLGYLLGMAIRRDGRPAADILHSQLGKVALFTLGAAGMLVAVIVLKHGATLFRWGTVSLDFFLLSLVVLPLTTALSVRLDRPLPRAVLAIEGIASLLVVPVHGFFLEMHWLDWKAGGSAMVQVLSLVALLVVSVVIARALANAMAVVGGGLGTLAVVLVGLIVTLVPLLLVGDSLSSPVRWVLTLAAQLLLAFFFVRKPADFLRPPTPVQKRMA